MIQKKCDIANLALGFSFKQNNDDKRNKSHISFICFRNVAFQSACCMIMYQSNRSLNIPPKACPGRLTSFPAREGGNLMATHRG